MSLWECAACRDVKTHCDHQKHALGHVEGVPPIMVHHGPVVLPYSQEPAAQHLYIHRHDRNMTYIQCSGCNQETVGFLCKHEN